MANGRISTFVLGLVVGATLSALATWQLLRSETSSDPRPASSAPDASKTFAAAATDLSTPLLASTLTAAMAHPTGEPDARRITEQPPSGLAVARETTARVESEYREEPMTPVPLSTAHSELMEQAAARARLGEPTIENYHQQLEAEDLATDWAYPIEEHLRTYLTEHAPSPDFDVVAIHCRTTMCEIQAFGYSDAASEQWKTVLSGMRQEYWWAFTQESSVSSASDGRATLLTILHRP